MKVITTVKEMQLYVKHNYKKDRKIAFVPTMGYFHDGHVMLMREARKQCDRLIVSIFVNPLQFGRGEDYASYPRDMKKDLALARQCKANVVFSPSREELYPAGYSTHVEEERLSKKLCGFFRPGHFKGVSTIVAKLFNIVRPHAVFLGQKDAQQAAIIKKMVADLNYSIDIVVMPTIREESGLACSSRNEYLNARERKEASILYQALQKADEMVKGGARDAVRIIHATGALIAAQPLVSVEYVELVNPETLERVPAVKDTALLAVAARVGKARLIDNIILGD